MDILMIILRLIHIGSAVVWVGGTLFLWRFVTPAVQKMGADGAKFMRALLNDTPYLTVIPATAILAVLSGAWMYIRDSQGFNADWFQQPSTIVLTIGALAGLAAAGHGLAVIKPIADKIKALGAQIASAGGPPTPEQGAQMQALSIKMGRNVQILVYIMIVAVIGMSTFRYF